MGKSRKARAKAKEATVKQEAVPAQAPAAEGKNEQKISMVIHGAGGIVAGAASYYAGTTYALPVGIVLLFIVVGGYMKMSGKEKLGMWAAPGIFLYLFMWLDAWLFLYNFL
jgi:hypothetical protein